MCVCVCVGPGMSTLLFLLGCCHHSASGCYHHLLSPAQRPVWLPFNGNITHSGGGRLIETHNCWSCCSCDSDRLRRGLHGIIPFGITGPLPQKEILHTNGTLVSVSRMDFSRSREPHPPSPALVGGGQVGGSARPPRRATCYPLFTASCICTCTWYQPAAYAQTAMPAVGFCV